MEENDRPPVDEEIEELLRVPSIGNLSARALSEEGFKSISQLKEAGLERIRSVENIGARRASDIYMEIKKGKVKEESGRFEELECPECSNFVRVDDEKCSECGKTLEMEGRAVLPDEGVIENPKEVLAEVERKIRDGEGEAKSWFVCGSILENLGAKKKALEAYDKVIELDPLYEHIWNAKASLSLKLGKTQEAARAYKVAFDAHGAPAGMMDQLPETTPAEEEVEFEEDEAVKKAEEKISEARSAVERLSEEDLDLRVLRSMLDEATQARLDDDLDLAVDKADEVIKKCESAQSFVEAMKEADEHLADLKEKDEERYQEYRETFDELEESIEEKGFEDLVEKTQRLIHEIDEEMKIEEDREEKLTEMIEEGKNILKEKRDSKLHVGPLKNDLKEAIKKKKMEKFEEGIEKVKTMEKRAEIVSDIDELLVEFKERLKETENEEVVEKIKKDTKDIIELSKGGDYRKIKNWIGDLFYALDWELKRSKERKESRKVSWKKISELKALKEELSEETAEMSGVLETISNAEEAIKEESFDGEIEEVEWLLADDDLLKEISELFEKVKTKKAELEKSEASEETVKELEELIEGGKEECRDGEHEDAIITFRSVLEKIEEKIEEESEELEGEISDAADGIEDVLDKAEEKEIEITGLKEEFEEIKKSEGDKREKLGRLKELREKGKASLRFLPIVSEIEEKIEEEGNGELEEYKSKLAEVKEKFESGEREEAIKEGEELKDDVEMILEMKGAEEEKEEEKEAEEEEEEIEVRPEEALEEAKEKLAELRGSELGLGKLKGAVRKANQAKKEGDHQKTEDFADKAIEASTDLKAIIELREEAEEKLDELAEEGLVKDEGIYEREVERYRRATNIGVYEAIKKNLKDLVEELEEGLEKEEELPIKEDQDIAKEIKGKIRELKDLHADVEKSGIEIQIDKQYLKEAIPKIKAKAYEEAFETLLEGEKDLLDKLGVELEDKVGSLRERIESSDIEVGGDRVQMFTDEIERIWRSGDHRATMELLAKTSELVGSLEESGSKKERRILTASQIVKDAENFEFDLEKEKRLLDEARETDEDEDVKENIEKIKTSLASKLSDRIKEEVEKVDERVEEVSRERTSVMLDRLTKAESGRRSGDVGKMIWYWKKYREASEE